MNTHVPHAHSVKSDICSLIPAACPRKKIRLRITSCTQKRKRSELEVSGTHSSIIYTMKMKRNDYYLLLSFNHFT